MLRKCKLRRYNRLSQPTNATKRLKTNLPDYILFSTGKLVISAIEKCRRILITIHDTTDAMYTTIQCLQKRYRPLGEIIKEIQSHFNISCPVFITFVCITTDSINERCPCTQRSAQKNFHAAIISRLAPNAKRTNDTARMLQSIEKRSQSYHKTL